MRALSAGAALHLDGGMLDTAVVVMAVVSRHNPAI